MVWLIGHGDPTDTYAPTVRMCWAFDTAGIGIAGDGDDARFNDCNVNSLVFCTISFFQIRFFDKPTTKFVIVATIGFDRFVV